MREAFETGYEKKSIPKDMGCEVALELGCYLSLIFNALPVVNHYCNFFFSAIPVFLMLFFIMRKNDGKIFAKVYLLLLVVIVWGILTYIAIYRSSGNSLLNKVIKDIIVWVPCFMAISIGSMQAKPFFRRIMIFYVTLITITSVTTLLGYSANPMASRLLASGTEQYGYDKLNIGGFEFIYSLVLSVPMLWYLMSNSKKAVKWVYVFIILLYLFTVQQSQYTIALILMISILVMLACRVSYKGSIVIVMVVVATFFMFREPLAAFFSWVESITPHEYVSSRFRLISQFLLGANYDTDSTRIDVYRDSINSFLASPIIGTRVFGNANGSIGGHSTILDIMGAMGLVGLSAFFLFIMGSIRKVIYSIKKHANRYVYITILMFFVFSLVNPSFSALVFQVLFINNVCILKDEQMLQCM